MRKLIPLFILLPLIELQLLVWVHGHIGFFYTVGIIILTGIFGIQLAKREGLNVMRSIQESLNRGIMPTQQLIEGVIILVGGVLLITPGVLTDLFGLTCLLPGFRLMYKTMLIRIFKGKIQVMQPSAPNRQNPKGPLNVDYREVDEE